MDNVFGEWELEARPTTCLTKIEVAVAVSYFELVYINLPMNVKYNEDGTILVSAKDVEGHFVVPESVAELGQYAFKDCVGLKSIEFPSSMKRIGFLLSKAARISRISKFQHPY